MENRNRFSIESQQRQYTLCCSQYISNKTGIKKSTYLPVLAFWLMLVLNFDFRVVRLVILHDET